MLTALIVFLRAIGLLCRGHRAVALENLALRQQLAALSRWLLRDRATIYSDAIPQEPSRPGVVREGFNDLLRGPFGGRMVGDREVDDAPTLVREQHQDEEHAAVRVGTVKKSIETRAAT
jgi:hypothetical protein